jgi:hypothetical protein
MKPDAPSPLTRVTTRVTLSTGYRAYQPSDAVHKNNNNSSNSNSGNQKKRAAAAKRVRFVKGHVTIPDDIFALSRRDRPQQQQQQQQQQACAPVDIAARHVVERRRSAADGG